MSDEIGIKSSSLKLRVLPLEMWDAILGEIYEPNDILRCCDVCYNWNLLLQPKRTSAYFQLILSKLLPYLSTNDLLSCSVVSKDWNHWIDTSVMNFRKNNVFWANETHRRLPYLWLEEADIERFMAEKEEFAGNQLDNPLAYRHVLVTDDEDEDMDDAAFEVFCQRLIRFLERFGKYIFQLQLKSSNDIPVQLAQMLSICLSNTPNLEVFICEFDTEVEGEDVQLIDDFFATTALPNSTIRKLQMDYPKELVDVLVHRYGNQLVDVYDFNPIQVTELITRGVTFQNIKVFRSSVCGSSFSAYETNDLDYITNLLPILKWNLEEVDLAFLGGFDYFAKSFAKFFKALQKHQPTVQTLRLRLALPQLRSPGHLYSFSVLNLESMEMPNLKRLTLDQVGVPPVRFFQKATPGLEYLIIYHRDNYEWFSSDANLDMMWEALPNCKMIKSSNAREERYFDHTFEQHTNTFVRN